MSDANEKEQEVTCNYCGTRGTIEVFKVQDGSETAYESLQLMTNTRGWYICISYEKDWDGDVELELPSTECFCSWHCLDSRTKQREEAVKSRIELEAQQRKEQSERMLVSQRISMAATAIGMHELRKKYGDDLVKAVEEGRFQEPIPMPVWRGGK